MNRTITTTHLLLIGTALALSGCMGMQSQTTMDNIAGAAGGSNKPYVEAYVEYRGPAEKWSGPSTFLMRVVAKDGGPAQISITPPLFDHANGKDGTVTGRLPASKGMTGETAREMMSHMAQALQGMDAPFRGCLSPVRVRLVRADGIVLEKQGCRGQTGWSKTASESVNQFITASLYGTVPRPATAAH